MPHDTEGKSAKKMKKQKCNFRYDTEAVSEVIGMVLLLAVLVTFFTLIQVSVVPDWNKKVEADHIPAVYDDMTSLSSDIADSASRAIAKSSSIQLGARYPDRMIFLNSGPGAFGTLTVENDVDATVECRDVDEEVIASRNYTTSRIIYELTGTVNSPKLVYEHGIIIRDWGNGEVLGPVPPENHTLFDNRSANVYIPIVHGSSISTSSLDSTLVSIFPFTESEKVDDIANLTITLDTDYPEVWKNISRSTDNITVAVSFPDKEIRINSTEIEKIYLPLTDDVISSDLYTGMITGSATLEGGLWISGEGTDVMAIGSRVANVPNSAITTAIVIQDMVVDETLVAKLDSDFILITVTDFDGNWWKAVINLRYAEGSSQKQVETIEVKSANGVSNYLAANFEFTESTVIDLFDPANFDSTVGLYQNAGVGSNNRLVTNIADETNQKALAMIFFRLRWEAD